MQLIQKSTLASAHRNTNCAFKSDTNTNTHTLLTDTEHFCSCLGHSCVYAGTPSNGLSHT